MRCTFKYRLYPNRRQAEALDGQLAEACRLYNAALQERRDAYRMAGKSLTYYDQAAHLKAIRTAGDLGLANLSASQDVLRRVDRTLRAFFTRIKTGQKAGYPRFKSRRRFDSYTFPAYGDGCRLRANGRLYLQGVGEVKVKLHRPVVGDIKTVTVKRECGRWYACFSVECASAPLPPTDQAVGVDVGLLAFAALSDGSLVENPRHARKAQTQLRRAQRKVARRKKGGHRRRKAVALLARAHLRVANQRRDFHHKVARSLVNTYGLIAVEDLNVKGLAGGMLARSVHDAGWGAFLTTLAHKAEEAGRVLVRVNPNGTSQVCSQCRSLPDVPKTLADRIHRCSCGAVLDRDVNAARNILRLGLSLQASTSALAGVA